MKKEDVLIITGKAESWEDAIHLTGKELLEEGFVKEGFDEACILREKMYPTGLLMETSIAIPHTEDSYVNKSGVCILIMHEPVEFCRMDSPEETVSTRFVFNLALLKGSEQVGMLQKLVTAFSDVDFVAKVLSQPEDQLLDLFVEKLVGE